MEETTKVVERKKQSRSRAIADALTQLVAHERRFPTGKRADDVHLRRWHSQQRQLFRIARKALKIPLA